jgi:hypothetical protein
MMGENHRRLRRRRSILFFFLLPALLTGCGSSDLQFPTPYQAVYLDNGQVFFGRLQDTGSAYFTLRDVFYIAQQVAPDKKEVKSLLLKRGGEAHAPDFMRINARHVVLIEPVAPDSRVAQLIMEAHKPPAPAPKEEPKPAPGK